MSNTEKNCIVVYEYDKICISKQSKNILREGKTVYLNEKDFSELRKFVLIQEANSSSTLTFEELRLEEPMPCMKLSANKSGEETLTVQNFVGTIKLSTGKTIEILPKIYKNAEDKKPRELVINMLKSCGIISYKSFQNANIGYEKMSIFEIYIRIFIDEVFALYKKGLKLGYVQKQENEKFLKGKLLFSKHIKHNFAHAERFFVEYDEFNVNRPENKLIKTTIDFLSNISKEDSNKRNLRQLINIFYEVEKSTAISSDFQRCTGGRNMKEYENVLSFCKVFLQGYSFSNYRGKHDTIALLFPMEKLFEKYIALKLAKEIKGWTVKAQARAKYLFDKINGEDGKKFLLKPDIYMTNNSSKEVIIMDTKWKQLDETDINYGISQADVYQMYAYHTRYKNVKEVLLLYPTIKTDKTEFKKSLVEFGIADNNVKVSVWYVPISETGTEFNVKDIILNIIGSKNGSNN